VKPSRNVFSILLPCLDLAIWLALIVGPVGLDYFRPHHQSLARDFGVIYLRKGTYRIEAEDLPWFLVVTEKMSQAITAINLPAMTIEMLTSIKTWPDSWSPALVGLESWRSFVFPFYCLPFWWFAGHGIDALIGRRRLSWFPFTVGTLFFALFAILLFGMRFCLPESDPDRKGITWILLGFGLWASLFAAFPMAWVLQRTSDRRRRSAVA
jgi:hypothetical protein